MTVHETRQTSIAAVRTRVISDKSGSRRRPDEIPFTSQLNSQEVLPSAIFWTSRGHTCRPFLPPGTCLQFLLRTRYTVQHSHCSSIFIECCQLTLSRFPPINFSFYPRKSPYEYVHSVRIELAKLILVGTRITYEATGDAGYLSFIYFKHTKL